MSSTEEFVTKLATDLITKIYKAIAGDVEAERDLAKVLSSGDTMELEQHALIASQRKAAGDDVVVDVADKVALDDHVRAVVANALRVVKATPQPAGKPGTVIWSKEAHDVLARRFVRALIRDLASAQLALGTLEAEQKARGL